MGLWSRLGDGSANFASAQSALFRAGRPRVAVRETSTEAICVDEHEPDHRDERSKRGVRQGGRNQRTTLEARSYETEIVSFRV